MTASDLCTEAEYLKIREHITNRETFGFHKVAKSGRNRITLRLCGRKISQELADSIWHGHDYLVYFDIDYNTVEGIGGGGYATDTFGSFETWNDFKNKIDARLMRFPFYEREQEEQLSLF